MLQRKRKLEHTPLECYLETCLYEDVVVYHDRIESPQSNSKATSVLPKPRVRVMANKKRFLYIRSQNCQKQSPRYDVENEVTNPIIYLWGQR